MSHDPRERDAANRDRAGHDFWDNADQPRRLTSFQIGPLELSIGDRVRLRPTRRADIFDMALAGKVAIIEAIEQDFEGRIHLAVVVEDDPGRDLGQLRQVGHRFFYLPEEVEPLPLPDDEPRFGDQPLPNDIAPPDSGGGQP